MFLQLTLALITVAFSKAQNHTRVEYLVNVINRAFENGLTYELPTSAYEYCSDSEFTNVEGYDFIVVGSGSAGAVVASRLSEIPNWKVLLLEAGDWGDNLTDIPNMYTPSAFTHYNWGFNSTPLRDSGQGLVNKECPYERGRGVGGSSLVNGLVDARGYKYDYDRWEKAAGNKRWGWGSVLDFFKKSENFVHNDPSAPYEPAYHGKGGYFQVEYHVPRSPILNRFLKANVENGFKIADYNANKLGASIAQQNTKNGKRWDTGNAYLRPVRDRPNLKIWTRAYVTKIRINKNKVATGVEFTYKNKNYFGKSNKEVILSGGAIDSPKILMLSGVGPKQHLDDLGIKVIEDLPGVGDNLQDNTAFYGLSFVSDYSAPDETVEQQVEDYLNGRGSLTVANNNQGVGFYESSLTKGKGIPEIELEIVPPIALNNLSQRYFSLTDQLYQDLWGNVDFKKLFQIYVIGLHPLSSGNIRLKSKSPFDYPLINSNFLSDPENKDINTLYEGVQLALNLTQSKSFKSINTKVVAGPVRACQKHKYLSRKYWLCLIRQLTFNLYHPSGTCVTGTDPKKGAVVNWELKVFGIEGLRVADTSIMPVTLAGHTNAPAVMIGEQAADLCKKSHKA